MKHLSSRSLLLLALCSLAACGGGGSDSTATSTPDPGKVLPVLNGIVAGARVHNPGGFAKSAPNNVFDTGKSTTGESVVSTYHPVAYDEAKVCVDVNGNGRCDAAEDSTTTDADGTFALPTDQAGPLLAVVEGPSHMILRADAAQRALSTIVISPLSSEVARTMAADTLSFDAARAQLAARLSFNNTPAQATDVTVTASQVLADLSALTDAKAQRALLMEQNALASRYALATAMFERGHIGAGEPVATLAKAQDAAFGLEDIPRYDHLFVIIFENHPNQFVDTPEHPTFFQALNLDGNKAANYESGGSPSEPNYVILGSADDWGITDDSGWNCTPFKDGAPDPVYAPSDVHNPRGNCEKNAHNVKGSRNLFNALFNAGLPARVYSESMDPGQDPRNNGNGNTDIKGANRRYQAPETMPGGLYATKHHPAINFDEVRNRPNYFRDLNRTAGGGQWDSAIETYAAANHIPWNVHQLEDDLASGDIGTLNYIVPDQCDDAHGLQPDPEAPYDCDLAENGMQRADDYLKYLLGKIKASPAWTNHAKRTGIVLVFDEGSVYPGKGLGQDSCCGWNPGGGATSGHPLDEDSPPYDAYANGNKGDGPNIFGVMNNHAAAPRGVVDSDTYSHYSFVRTLQDMFALADPGVPSSFMNRSKYTESYIAEHILQLTEYAGSADPHFDAVRPMNHAYAVKPGDTGLGGTYIAAPDLSQTNIWSLK